VPVGCGDEIAFVVAIDSRDFSSSSLIDPSPSILAENRFLVGDVESD
jgi:hypothetical protein